MRFFVVELFLLLLLFCFYYHFGIGGSSGSRGAGERKYQNCNGVKTLNSGPQRSVSLSLLLSLALSCSLLLSLALSCSLLLSPPLLFFCFIFSCFANLNALEVRDREFVVQFLWVREEGNHQRWWIRIEKECAFEWHTVAIFLLFFFWNTQHTHTHSFLFCFCSSLLK